jgi:putative hydrolase of the HAD superfamily
MPKKLRALFVDIDDTLYSTSDFARNARRHAMEAMVTMGVRMSASDLLRELYEVIGEFGGNYQNHYDRLLRRIPQELLPHGNPSLIVAAAVVAYHDTKHRSLFPFRDVPVVLSRVKEHTDLRLGCITEGLEIKQAEKLVRLGVLQWIDADAVFISDRIGISKPNVKLYQRALDAVGVEPEEAMYVGDHPVKDIEPVKAIGMIAVRHRWHGGKYADIEPATPPDYEITSFHELLPILRDDFGFADL